MNGNCKICVRRIFATHFLESMKYKIMMLIAVAAMACNNAGENAEETTNTDTTIVAEEVAPVEEAEMAADTTAADTTVAEVTE